MYSFFVLGQIPGTSLVITFWMWVQAAILLCALLAWVAYRHHNALANYTEPTISDEPGTLKSATAQ